MRCFGLYEARTQEMTLRYRAGVSALVLLFPLLVACGGGANTANSSGTSTTAPAPSFVAPLPWVYSQIFSSTSPLHTTVATLKTSGATTLSQAAMVSLWSQGVANQDLSPSSWMFPVYVSSASDPIKTFTCTKWGFCNAHGRAIHVPSGALPEAQSDGHIAIIDTVLNLEVDGWQCTANSSSLDCSWGGAYSLGGSGLENTGSAAVHGGFAAGLFVITAQELLNGQINHALGLLTKCLNDPTVYPADAKNGTDQSCGATGAPSYGNLVHLLWTPAQIAASPYSLECKTVLNALATYGAYTFDTGNGGLAFLTQHQFSYTATGQQANPWTAAILPHLTAAGDANGTWWNSCLNHLSASDFELLQIPAGSY